MPTARSSAGPIEYDDRGEGPPLVLCPAVWAGANHWSRVADRLVGEFRCISPALPVGAHRLPMRPEADLSLRGHARLVAELLSDLDVRDATVAFNDFCPAPLMIADRLDDRIGRLVLVAVETDDNYPPGLPGRILGLTGHVPGGLAAAARMLAVPALRRAPFTLGSLSHGTVPGPVLDGWAHHARSSRAVRRDLRKYVVDTGRGRRDLRAASAALGRFDRPVLVVWGCDDKVMPGRSGRRLADAFPNSRFEKVPGARTFVPWDQPGALAELIRQFAGTP